MSEEQQCAPISWAALAAELAAGRRAAAEQVDGTLREDDPATWDAVAADLAARVAQRPAIPDDVPAHAVLPDEDLPAAAQPAHPEPEPEPAAEELDPETLPGALEALLFVMADPVDEETLAAALRCTRDQVRSVLAELAEGYDRRRAGITLRRAGEGWRLYTREEHADVVQRYLTDGSRGRLTQAALETLAVIAYRQPVTRAQVSAVRGVGVDGVMRTLLARGLVQEVGTDPDSGGRLYGTTPLFLERLGLRGLDELPELALLLPETAAVLEEHPDA